MILDLDSNDKHGSYLFLSSYNTDSFLKLTKNNYMYICMLRNEEYHSLKT